MKDNADYDTYDWVDENMGDIDDLDFDDDKKEENLPECQLCGYEPEDEDLPFCAECGAPMGYES